MSHSKRNFSIMPLIFLLIGLLMLASAFYIWKNILPQNVSMSKKTKPMGFSLSLSDKEVARLSRSEARQFWKTSSAKDFALPNGFLTGLLNIWPQGELTAKNPFKMAPVKIIPTGGLFPFYLSRSFSAEMESFVKKGGSLICFGQPLGRMYRSLPGRQLRGVGWSELGYKSWEGFAEGQVIMDHPMLATIAKERLEVHYGGFFTKIPGYETTKTILRDSQTGRPIIVTYRYGKGLVIVTTLVSDAAAVNYKISEDELALLNGMLTWAQSGGPEMPQFAPNEQPQLTYTFPPATKGTAREGFIEIYGPGDYVNKYSRPLPQDDTQLLTESLEANTPGIWQVVSYQRNSHGEAVSEKNIYWFAIGHALPAEAGAPFLGTVSLPGKYFSLGSVIPLHIHLWNDSLSDSEITFRGPGEKATLNVVSGQYRKFKEELTLLQKGKKTLKYDFYSSDGHKMATIKRQIEVTAPDQIFLNIAKNRSSKTTEFSGNLEVYAINPGKLPALCDLQLIHNGQVLWEDSRDIILQGSQIMKEKIKFPLPQNIKGKLILTADLTLKTGSPLAQTWLEI